MTALPEIELEFGDGLFMFRLPALYIDRLQKERGYDVTWPDGAQGKKPKPFGQIYREHMTGDYDVLDSMAVIKLGLTAGRGGVVAGAAVTLDPTKARMMAEEVAAMWPIEQIYLFAMTVLRACTYGYTPTAREDSEPGNETPPQTGDSSTSEQPSETSPSSDKDATG
jgi:hypothetical protein